jgi:general secretion pathway protein I
MPRARHGGRTGRHPHQGFGLLEAIVALALLAGTGMALFSWIQQNLDAASRLRGHEQRAQLLLSAQALVETVNPMRTPSGQLDAGDLALTWQAEPIEPPRANATFNPETPAGPWQVGLYRLQVQARDRKLGTEIEFEQWRIGTQRAVPVIQVAP